MQSQKAGLLEGALGGFETDLFDMRVEDAIRLLEEKLVELERRLDSEVQSRYRLMAEKGMRAVVPVLSGICYGCFVAVPTAWAAESERNLKLDVCDHCGRFLYHLD